MGFKCKGFSLGRDLSQLFVSILFAINHKNICKHTYSVIHTISVIYTSYAMLLSGIP